MASQPSRTQRIAAIFENEPNRATIKAKIYRDKAKEERLNDVSYGDVPESTSTWQPSSCQVPIIPSRPAQRRVAAETLNVDAHVENELSRAPVEINRVIQLPTPDASTISSPEALRAADDSLECLQDKVLHMQIDIQLMKQQLDGREEEIGSLKARLNDIEEKYQESILDLQMSEAEKDRLRSQVTRLVQELKRTKNEKQEMENELNARRKVLSDTLQRIDDSERQRIEDSATRDAENERRLSGMRAELRTELMAHTERATQQTLEDARRMARHEKRREPRVKVVVNERSQSRVSWSLMGSR